MVSPKSKTVNGNYVSYYSEHYGKRTAKDAYKRLLLGFKITPTAMKVKIQVNHTTSSSKNNGSVNYMMIDEN